LTIESLAMKQAIARTMKRMPRRLASRMAAAGSAVVDGACTAVLWPRGPGSLPRALAPA